MEINTQKLSSNKKMESCVSTLKFNGRNINEHLRCLDEQPIWLTDGQHGLVPYKALNLILEWIKSYNS